MQGFKTIIAGLVMAIVPVATQYLGAIDWNTALPAPWSFVASGVVIVVMRFLTTTPVFEKE
jgi:hypothetical protein